MLNGKQRAALRSMAATIETIVHVGKSAVTDSVAAQMSDALEARELVKGRVLDNAGLTAREACEILAQRCHAEPVQVIGSRFVLYRKKPETAKPPAKPKGTKKPAVRTGAKPAVKFGAGSAAKSGGRPAGKTSTRPSGKPAERRAETNGRRGAAKSASRPGASPARRKK